MRALALLLGIGIVSSPAVGAPDWIDLGEEGRHLFLTAEFAVPERGEEAELSLATAALEDRCSVGIDAEGRLRGWLYPHERTGPILDAGRRLSLLIQVVGHRDRPDELRVLVGTPGRRPAEPASIDDWTMTIVEGNSNANLSRIALRGDAHAHAFRDIRIEPTYAGLAGSPNLDDQALRLDPTSERTRALPTNLRPAHPETNPGSTLMLDLPGTGTDPSGIDYSSLPVIEGDHAVVSTGDPQWQFRLHNYLAHHDGRYWCFWSHGPVIEDKATQHLRYATSPDGLKWSDVKVLAGPPRDGYGYIARGLWVRDGELLALASLFEAPGYSGGDLELQAFRRAPGADAWEPAGKVFDDAINNFPPKRLPGGAWMMSRRASDRSVSILIGGVDRLDDWDVIPFSSYARDDGARPEEPFWAILPDGRNLVGLFRDNGGSKRLLRAFSTDEGRTWSPPIRTNFPDATSKFHALQTRRGDWVMASNPNPKGRNPLCLSLSRDGLVYTRMFRLPIPDSGLEPGRGTAPPVASARRETLQYPHIIEHEGHLLIAFSRNKQSVEVVKIALDAIP